MALEVGIVGLPLVGKTTLFNALTSGHAEATAYTKASTKPNVGVAKVPDRRLNLINEFIETEKIVNAAIQVVDVAGLSRGAGEGGANKFLAHIRDMDALVHVVRCFESDEVIHVDQTIDPARDVDTIETELIFADYEQVTASLDKARRSAKSGDKDSIARAAVLEAAQAQLNEGKPVRDMKLSAEQQKLIKSMGLLTAKKVLTVANVGEDDVHGRGELVQKLRARCEAAGSPVVAICAKLEAEIAELSEADRAEMLKAMDLEEPALALLAREMYKLLGLQSFFTAGPKEIRAWTIPIGATAPQAAGAIHTDFERGFIRVEIYTIDDLKTHKTEQAIKAAGKLRVEGKNYVMKDGDVSHFLFNV